MFPKLRRSFLRQRPALYVLLLIALNSFIVRRLFTIEFTEHMNSNEGTFLAIGRFILRDWPHLSWFPFWFNGLPFENTYSPLLHFIDAAVAKLAGCSTALAFHAVTAGFYCLGPALLFWFAWKRSGFLETSLSVALLYSLASPSALFCAVRTDMSGWTHARRLQTLVHYGEGPHNAVLCLLPLALLILCLAFTGTRLRWYVASGVVFGAVVLTNAFGAIDLALGVGCLLLAYSPELRRGRVAALLAAAFLSYLWISPFLTPTLILTIAKSSALASGFHYRGRNWIGALLVLAGLAVLWLATRTMRSRFERFLLLWAFLFTAIPALAYWADTHVLPQAERYHLEMELAVCLAAPFFARHLLMMAGPPVRIGVIWIFTVVLVRQSIACARYAEALLRPIDITTTVEYKIAKWIDRNLPGRRTMVSDDAGTWFNVFTDNPQFSSGHDPFSPNWMVEVAVYAIYSGENAGANDAQNSITWLKAYGNHAVTVPGPNSREVYKPYRNPRKFEGVLPVLWHAEDDTIYRIPQRSASLAHVIPSAAAIVQPPAHGLDTGKVADFVAALEDPGLPLAEMHWLRSGQAHISATVEPGEVVAVQVTYDRGWKAIANGRAAPIVRDGIGLMVLHPDCRGRCEIDLTFEGGLERNLCWLASLLVTVGTLGTIGYRLPRKRRMLKV